MPLQTLLLLLTVFGPLATAGPALALVNDLPLRDNVGVAEVSGGDRANGLWDSLVGDEEFRRALLRSLDSAGLLERARGEGRFAISAVLEAAEQIGVGFAASTRVRYTLTDRKCGESVYQESISAEYAPKMWDTFMSPRISRQLSEGAARVNIGILTEQLLRMSLFQDRVSMTQ